MSIERKNKSVVVYLDAPPISESLHQITDYSSYLMYTLCSMPLMSLVGSTGQLQPLGAANFIASYDYKVFEFRLRNDIFWNNGEQVKAMHYAKAFDFIMKDKKNRFRRQLIDFFGCDAMVQKGFQQKPCIEYKDNIIQFRLSSPNYYFPMIISAPVFSPLHSNKKLFCGHYFIKEMGKEYVELTRNKYIKSVEDKTPINKIILKKNTNLLDPFAIDAFNKTEVDVTSDTAFPYDQYHALKSQGSLVESSVDISCMLTENKNVPENLTKILIHGINRNTLVSKLYKVPSVNCGHSILFDKSTHCFDYLYNKKLFDEYLSKVNLSNEITVSYEEFYPNREILNLIAEQLTVSGLRFKFLAESYGARLLNTHYRLTLLKSFIPDPFFFYKNAEKSVRFNKFENQKNRFKILLSLYQRTGNASDRKEMAVIMDHILIEVGQYVPLLKIPGLYLKNPMIQNADLFVSGQTWYF